MPTKNVRAAMPGDAGTIVELVRSLAIYEKEPVETVQLTESDVLRDGFGDSPRFEALLAELDGKAVGFALFFHNYSTWIGKPGLYLEDLYVEEQARGYGLGLDLMQELARIAEERGCARFELSVLDWNPTREFYHQLGFEDMDDWLSYRLTQPGIEKLARG
ncbi:MAG: GNAT family N-acetyltransferase [Chloroflexi bacterium]|jgi:GNAT superfamily N-acetyltransferase|nr:GNAT family N-acetyltransferase [Chloroflexota bacterium]MBT4072300.1 GNAT family N-acetyltransferase [Chloroflexota bacterium]MBT4514006.1 GNAT family N-acetyltransferase [Chloroflexota bacterium]MBT5320559.1 GNAT family N-acetyltransferase [Chloroflexota bacterium]MBT6681640.1 GNAT family N-acetyltransferase [Chloroflexota bacterium]